MQVRWKNTFISTLSRPISELWNTGQPGQMPDWITWTRTETFEGEIRFYGEHRITDEQWVYYFVGGRRSLIRFFADRASRTILAPHGSSIGLIMERKHYVFKKDMTLVALCDIGARSPYPIGALSDFRGVPNLNPPVDPTGASVTTKQLAAILTYEFARQPVVTLRQNIAEFVL